MADHLVLSEPCHEPKLDVSEFEELLDLMFEILSKVSGLKVCDSVEMN
jgi:hypothetical protein